MPRNAVLNRRRHRLLRKHVPLAETWSSFGVLVVLATVVVWVISTRDDYDRAVRELPDAYLEHGRPPIELYHRPFQHWREPGSAGAAGSVERIETGPFPPAVQDSNWQLRTRIRSFDATNLYEKINGEAEKFLKRGFRAMHYAVLRNLEDGTELAIELYDMSDLAGSLSIFAAHRSASREVTSQAGVDYFTTGIGLIGRVGQFFFRAASDRETPAVEEKSRILVDAFSVFASNQGEAGGQPVELSFLRQTLDVGESAVSFEQRNVFQFDFAQNFWFAALGDSKAGAAMGEGARAFVHVAESPAAAEALLALLQEELSFDFSTPEIASARTLGAIAFRHEFLNTFFVLARSEAVIVGVEKMLEPDAAVETVARLLDALGATDAAWKLGSPEQTSAGADDGPTAAPDVTPRVDPEADRS